MKPIDKLTYCQNVIKHNIDRFIIPFELEYYAGLTGKNPHGINDRYWQLAWKRVIVSR